MRLLPRFWKALDDVPGHATDALDWRQRLGDEFGLVKRYLRPTGEIVEAVDCPSPGGDGCPRHVVHLSAGRLRAVCGCSPSVCETVDLAGDDIAVLLVDRVRLAVDLVAALGGIADPLVPDRGLVKEIGQYAVAAGLSAPILLVTRYPGERLTASDLPGVLGDARVIVLSPRAASLSTELRAMLRDRNHQLIDLETVIGIGASGRWLPVQQPEALLAPIRAYLLARTGPPAAPVFELPVGTTWERLTLTLTGDATLICSGPGIHRQLDPGDLGMRRRTNHKPTSAWMFLVSIIEGDGWLKIRYQKAAVRKQKEALKDRLQAAFGIETDPLPWDKRSGGYRARFTAQDQRPKASTVANSAR